MHSISCMYKHKSLKICMYFRNLLYVLFCLSVFYEVFVLIKKVCYFYNG